jgi:hypothetical protein
MADILGSWELHYSRTGTQVATCWRFVLCMYINTGLIPLLATLRIQGMENAPLGLFADGYQDLTAQWYDRTGQDLLVGLILTAVVQRASRMGLDLLLPGMTRWFYKRFVGVYTQVRGLYLLTLLWCWSEWNPRGAWIASVAHDLQLRR